MVKQGQLNPLNNTIQCITIRKAIRMMLRKAYVAKETSNRELYQEARQWLKGHIPQRNTGKSIYWRA